MTFINKSLIASFFLAASSSSLANISLPKHDFEPNQPFDFKNITTEQTRPLVDTKFLSRQKITPETLTQGIGLTTALVSREQLREIMVFIQGLDATTTSLTDVKEYVETHMPETNLHHIVDDSGNIDSLNTLISIAYKNEGLNATPFLNLRNLTKKQTPETRHHEIGNIKSGIISYPEGIFEHPSNFTTSLFLLNNVQLPQDTDHELLLNSFLIHEAEHLTQKSHIQSGYATNNPSTSQHIKQLREIDSDLAALDFLIKAKSNTNTIKAYNSFRLINSVARELYLLSINRDNIHEHSTSLTLLSLNASGKANMLENNNNLNAFIKTLLEEARKGRSSRRIQQDGFSQKKYALNILARDDTPKNVKEVAALYIKALEHVGFSTPDNAKTHKKAKKFSRGLTKRFK